MRQDQYEKLQALEERLLDVFLVEADPDTWPGAGILPANMDQQTRGNAYWVRKVAVSTLALAQRVGNMVTNTQNTGAGTTPTPDTTGEDGERAQLDDDIASAEREAKKLMGELTKGKGKAGVDGQS